jgi:hypothetical protein
MSDENWTECKLDSTCPHCGRANDGHTTTGSEAPAPQPGDISMCIGCGQFARFGDDMKLHAFTEEEKRLIGTDQEATQFMVRAKLAWLMLKAKQEQDKQ